MNSKRLIKSKELWKLGQVISGRSSKTSVKVADVIRLWRLEVCQPADAFHFKGTLSASKGLRPNRRDGGCTDDYLLRLPKAARQANLVKKLVLDPQFVL